MNVVTRARLFKKYETSTSLLKRTDVVSLLKEGEASTTHPPPTPIEDDELGIQNTIVEKNEIDNADPPEKLVMFLRENMEDCSRQRLRALLMYLRRVANVEGRVCYKDLQAALQENGIKISSRGFQMIIDEMGDDVGVDCEAAYNLLLSAQGETGRDSVLAMQNRNDLDTREDTVPDVKRSDLIKRLANHLYTAQVYFDIAGLRRAVQGKDADKSGRITTELMFLSCEEVDLPLYGALLKNLAKLCHETSSGYLRWPEFLSVLEDAQTKAWVNHPEMKQLAANHEGEKARRVTSTPAVGVKKAFIKDIVKKVAANQNTGLKETLVMNDKEELSVDDACLNEDTNSVTIREEQQAGDEQKSYEGLEVVAHSIGAFLRPDEHPGNGYGEYVKVDVKGRQVKVLKTIADDVASQTTTDLPHERLQLDWIYGYRGADSRGNIARLSNGEVVYFVSKFAILYNPDGHTQRHYKEHTESIRCVSIHANGMTVATGQSASKIRSDVTAHVRVWRADTLTTLQVISHEAMATAVTCLAFPKMKTIQKNALAKPKTSKKNPVLDRLAVVCGGKQKYILVVDSFTGAFLASTGVNTDMICDVGFNSKYSEILVTVGKEHIVWWKIYTSTIQMSALPDFESYLRAKVTQCMSHNMNGDLVTGDSNGTIYIWADGHNRITNFIKHAHDGPVDTVIFHRGTILSGGRDCFVNCWKMGKNMNKIGVLPVSRDEGGVRALQLCKKRIIIGTAHNSILAAVIDSDQSPSVLTGATFDKLPITQGHRSRVSDICIMPDTPYSGDCVTISLDSSLCTYSSHERRPLWKIDITGFSLTAMDTNSSGSLLVLGTTEGHLLILAVHNDTSFVEKFKEKVTSKPPTVIRVSPDDSLIAVGCGDRSVAIVAWVLGETEEEWQVVGKFKSHVSFITGIDWSRERHHDHYIIRSSSAAPDQQHWRVGNFLKEESNTILQEVSWATDSCCLDHAVIGLWKSKQGREFGVQAVDTNPERNLVVMGDTRGNLSLFRYPSITDGAFSHCYKSHLSVDRVRFSQGGNFVLTVGANDCCVMQWRIV